MLPVYGVPAIAATGGVIASAVAGAIVTLTGELVASAGVLESAARTAT
jgi:hypothetical protein